MPCSFWSCSCCSWTRTLSTSSGLSVSKPTSLTSKKRQRYFNRATLKPEFTWNHEFSNLVFGFFRKGFDQQRAAATGTHRFGVRLLLRLDSDHPVRCHVIPSFRNAVAYSGFDRTQLLQPEGKQSKPKGSSPMKNLKWILCWLTGWWRIRRCLHR